VDLITQIALKLNVRVGFMNLRPENEENLQTPASYPEIPSRPELPTLRQALYLFVLCLIFVGLIGSMLQVLNLKVGLLLTQILCLLLPTLLYAKSLGIDLKKTFRLIPIDARIVFITILTTGAAFTLVAQLAVLQERFLPAPPGYTQRLEEVLLTFRGMPLVWGMTLIALLPGICEELLFRGFILSGLLRRLYKWPSVILTGVLFGVLHLDIYRFIPVSVLGIIFGLMVLKTGSLLTGMLAHMTNNSLILILSRMVPLEEATAAVGEPKNIPLLFLLIASATLILGFRSMRQARQT